MTSLSTVEHGGSVPPSMASLPNLITVVRTVAAMALAVTAIVAESVPLAVAAFLCYWLGDILDGLVARRLGQETRFGAVFDIIADRACCSLCVVAILVLRPDMALPLAVFLVQFMVIDCQLTLSFLRWPILGPNDFHLVHRGLYRWNWSPPAKAVNTAALVLLVLVAPAPIYPLALALAIASIKTVSLVVVHRLPSPPFAHPAGDPPAGATAAAGATVPPGSTDPPGSAVPPGAVVPPGSVPPGST